jgi:hypothetical protein
MEEPRCGTEPCPGCYVNPDRKGKRKTYSFRNCPGAFVDEICEEERAVMHFVGDHRLCDDAKSKIKNCEFAAQ